ncbi:MULTISPECIES: type II toxin-antitoxin system RatA family toxin [unclassified Gilliamella]|uniref:type II toxin-antitoxin system RatA family toxin n=1 Tax=unclassified Gilliamella TaxID=2685620 RepID=UPI00226A72AC|nr:MULTISPECIES: type II toxin-antitoxin system RatA family toxin [unclassified Gilliamella]MCX8601257.1 type II toxin-antitoxin system RatA family toxin [Gilliamella sp. B3722]MCX8607411.1 type II toxin-antitoxin system RatA family toxin [Gilliamella sp. B3771]MCX8610400.1 type II toxin-antitoxin system RatA family toxin [Gilliamella sp. B3891]MCX8612931.1 type II toxin-antitoxin system RatA family toxin [Gilliamella sp. B3773]MCX8614840.1 type II toxin-antitoxin system RatA family toxin [Gil
MSLILILNLNFIIMAQVFYEVVEPYSVEQMFALVNDIAKYPEFVPDCIASGIIKKQDNIIAAFIEVEKFGFKKSFTTLNQLNEPNSIDLTLLEGPFKHLTGQWLFTPIEQNRSKISFRLDFEFKNKLLDLTFTPVFKEVMTNMVNAFSQRARQIY